MSAGAAGAFGALVRRDLLLAWRRRGDRLVPLAFFVMVTALFPLGVSPERAVLATLAPGVVWVGAVLATLLGMDTLFRSDLEDGTLEQMLLSPLPAPVLVLAKVLAHWLVTGLPLVLAGPVLAGALHLPAPAQPVLVAGLLLGTPALSLVGAVGASLTVGLRRGGMLLPVLLLPLYVPVLTFGAGAVAAAAAGLPAAGHLYALGAILALAATLAPWAAAAGLRISVA